MKNEEKSDGKPFSFLLRLLSIRNSKLETFKRKWGKSFSMFCDDEFGWNFFRGSHNSSRELFFSPFYMWVFWKVENYVEDFSRFSMKLKREKNSWKTFWNPLIKNGRFRLIMFSECWDFHLMLQSDADENRGKVKNESQRSVFKCLIIKLRHEHDKKDPTTRLFLLLKIISELPKSRPRNALELLTLTGKFVRCYVTSGHPML